MSQSLEKLNEKLTVYEDKAARVQAKLEKIGQSIADLKAQIEEAEKQPETEKE